MPSSSNKTQAAAAVAEQEQLPCPRCQSNNTKFCYYNNYNFAQPRYFCKACRRYWTQGGTLRNVPIGGGSRSKTSNKRTRTCTSPFTTSVPQPPISFNFPPTSSFTSLLNAQVPEFVGLGFDNFGYNNNVGIGGVWPSFMSFGSVGIGGGGGGDAWPQLGNDCFVWPDLAISAPRKCLK